MDIFLECPVEYNFESEMFFLSRKKVPSFADFFYQVLERQQDSYGAPRFTTLIQ